MDNLFFKALNPFFYENQWYKALTQGGGGAAGQTKSGSRVFLTILLLQEPEVSGLFAKGLLGHLAKLKKVLMELILGTSRKG